MRLSDENLAAYLAARGLLAQPERARIEAAGDGNINFVRRVRAADGSTQIVKQARDALERFPEYRVTTERIVFETRYLRHAAQAAPEHAHVLPRILDFDESERVLVLEDLGDDRLDSAARNAERLRGALSGLGAFLGAVHAATGRRVDDLDPEFRNDEMRELHGEHIFTLPYELGAFPLSDVVHRYADRALSAPGVRDSIAALRSSYYGKGRALVHGDVQPGNVLLQSGRPRLIDAEIAHLGDPAFDLGVVVAHVEVFALGASGGRREHDCGVLTAAYREAGGLAEDVERARSYAGVELLRRTLGAARLPSLASDARACAAIERSVALLRERD